jgi:hypothetical protein
MLWTVFAAVCFCEAFKVACFAFALLMWLVTGSCGAGGQNHLCRAVYTVYILNIETTIQQLGLAFLGLRLQGINWLVGLIFPRYLRSEGNNQRPPRPRGSFRKHLMGWILICTRKMQARASRVSQASRAITS